MTARRDYTDLVNEVFLIDGRFVLVEGIPVTFCGHCGEVTFSRETTEKIRRMAHMIQRRRRSCRDILCLLALLVLLPGCVSTRYRAPAELELPPGGADLGVELCNGVLWVDVTIDGRGPYAFLIDTGAEMTVIDTAASLESTVPSLAI